MIETIRFEIPFYRYIDASGRDVEELPELARDRNALLALYRNMQLTRIYDQQAITLQRTGQLGTYASTLGMEAIGAAIGHAMQSDDIFGMILRVNREDRFYHMNIEFTSITPGDREAIGKLVQQLVQGTWVRAV